MGTNQDKFVNVITNSIGMSAANTLTFSEINVGLNIFDKVGLLITRVEFDIGASSMQDLDTDGDVVFTAITSSNNITSLVPSQAEVIDQVSVIRTDGGAAANMLLTQRPFIHDFSTQPGGGLLIPPKPLYMAMTSSGMTVAGAAYIRLYFIIYKLSDSEYLELLETRRAFG